MTERPGLDAWMNEVDDILDQDEYGISWEASAMRVRPDPPTPTSTPFDYDPQIEWTDHDRPSLPDLSSAEAWVRSRTGTDPIVYCAPEVAARLQLPEGTRVWFDSRPVVGMAAGSSAVEVAERMETECRLLAAEMGTDLDETRRQITAWAQHQAVTFDQIFADLVRAIETWFVHAAAAVTRHAETLQRVQEVTDDLDVPGRPPPRMCPVHGEEMRAGQCRRCQRDLVRARSRARR